MNKLETAKSVAQAYKGLTDKQKWFVSGIMQGIVLSKEQPKQPDKAS